MLDHGCEKEPLILDFKSPIRLKFPKARLRKDFENKRLELSQARRDKYITLQNEIEQALNQLKHLKSIVDLLLERA